MAAAGEWLKKFFRSSGFLAFLITVLAVHAYASLFFLSRIDLQGRDLMFRLRHSFKQRPLETRQIVLVAIDDISTQKLKSRWPLPRSVYAEAISKLSAYKPKVIGFDFVFQGEDQAPGSDEIFQKALAEAGNVVIASYMDPGGNLISAHPSFESAAFKTALVNKMRDRDGVVRRAPLFLRTATTGKKHLSWESEIFLKAQGWTLQKLEEGLQSVTFYTDRGRFKVPAREGITDIDFAAGWNDFESVHFSRLLEGTVDPEIFKGKIVLVGLTALALHDFHETPFGSAAGLLINANAVLTLLRQQFLFRIPLVWSWLLLFFSLWLILRVTITRSLFSGLSTLLALVLLYVLVSFFMLWWNTIWDLWFVILASAVTFLGATLYKQFQTAFENIRLREESVRDPLTGFYTRRFLEVRLRVDVKKVLSQSRSFGAVDEVSVVMIDLDNFKLVNDTFGHQEGDRVLRRMGESIRTSVRKDELVCRFGGDEFCVILPGTTLENAVKFAEKIRLLIAGDPDLSYTTQGGVKTFRVTGSLGVASVKGARAMDPDNLLKAADRALYRAKKGGRNQVCAFDPSRDVLDGK